MIKAKLKVYAESEFVPTTEEIEMIKYCENLSEICTKCKYLKRVYYL